MRRVPAVHIEPRSIGSSPEKISQEIQPFLLKQIAAEQGQPGQPCPAAEVEGQPASVKGRIALSLAGSLENTAHLLQIIVDFSGALGVALENLLGLVQQGASAHSGVVAVRQRCGDFAEHGMDFLSQSGCVALPGARQQRRSQAAACPADSHRAGRQGAGRQGAGRQFDRSGCWPSIALFGGYQRGH